MRHEGRAVLFDMDDTLYPMQRYRRSAFAAVAAHLERTRGLDSVRSMRILTSVPADSMKGHELQVLVDAWRLPGELVAELVTTVREHRPAISLPPATRATLAQLRNTCRVGVVTNGPPAVQRRKAHALGLEALVDTVVYAAEHGSGGGKPEPEPFLEALRRLGVHAGDAVFVGDDEWCDVGGARLVGLQTIRLTEWRPADGTTLADSVIRSIADVPRIVALLQDWPVNDAA